MVLKGVARLLAPSGPHARLSILIFHRVLPALDPLFPGEQYASRFDEMLRWVGRWFRVLPLDEAVARLADGTLPSRPAAISFDDGYADNATQALPLLQRHGMSATFFIATSFLNGGRMWNDSIIESVRLCDKVSLDLRDAGLGLHPLGSIAQRQAAIESLIGQIKYLDADARLDAVARVERQAGVRLPSNLMMTDTQVRQLRDAGMQIGAHTCNHPILARLPDAAARQEILDGKAALESIVAAPVSLFAYPNGKPSKDYLAAHTRMVKEAGFSAAVSTAHGVSTSASDLYQLPRFTPWNRSRTRFGLSLLANLRHVRSEVV